MDDLTLRLPPRLAGELIEEGKVGQVITWRGADAIGILTLAADMTSAVTAVVASRKSFAEIARRLVRHASAKEGNAQEINIYLTYSNSVTALTVDNNEVGTAKLVNQVLQALDEANNQQADNAARSVD